MKIRLSSEYIEYIKELGVKFFNSKDIWIFGSRVDLTQKGGDIDIYLETDKKDEVLKSKLAFLREFDKRFGEQKVDLIVNNQSSLKEIYEIAKREGVKL